MSRAGEKEVWVSLLSLMRPDGWMDGWMIMDGWRDGWMIMDGGMDDNGWMDGLMN